MNTRHLIDRILVCVLLAASNRSGAVLGDNIRRKGTKEETTNGINTSTREKADSYGNTNTNDGVNTQEKIDGYGNTNTKEQSFFQQEDVPNRNKRQEQKQKQQQQQRKDRKRRAKFQAQNGSLGKIDIPVTQENKDNVQKAAVKVLKKQLKIQCGGRGKEVVEAKYIDFDKKGKAHVRFKQCILGMEVEGAALMVHIEPNGTITAINGEFLHDDDDSLVSVEPFGDSNAIDTQLLIKQALSEAGIEDGELLGKPEKAVVRRFTDGSPCLAWKQLVKYNVSEDLPGSGPQMDMIYADSTYSFSRGLNGQVGGPSKFDPQRPSQALCARHPKRRGFGASSTTAYTLTNAESTVGSVPSVVTQSCFETNWYCTTVSNSSTRISTGDEVVDAAHNYAIGTYEYFYNNFGRDSLDGNGMALISRVRFDKSFNNAFWDGVQMTCGDGDGLVFRPLCLAADVVAHEFTHGLTDYTSDLIYSGESGALNEAISDIFGAMVDRQEGATGNDIWLLGEGIYTPSTPGGAIRNMSDPAATGDYDYYPTRYKGTANFGGVHWNSGIASLAFKLLVTGGTHPRNKTSVFVDGIGFEAAAEIFYYANTECLTVASTFEMARFCTAEVFGGEFKANVHQAWDAVGVPGGALQPAILLENGVPVLNQSSTFYLRYELPGIKAGDSVACATFSDLGDADLYLRFGEDPGMYPHIANNDCSSYGNTSSEFCTTGAAPESTTLNVIVHDWAGNGFSDLTLQCSAVVALESGVEQTDQMTDFFLSYKLTGVQVGDIATCKINASDGDADLYMRFANDPVVDFYSTDNDCVSYTMESQEECSTGPAPANTILNIIVHAWKGKGFDDLSIVCSLESTEFTAAPTIAPTTAGPTTSSPTQAPPPSIILEKNVAVSGQNSSSFLRYELPGVQIGDRVVCTTLTPITSPGDSLPPDADLFLRLGQQPEPYPSIDNDCSSYNSDVSNEICKVGPAVTSETLYVVVYAYNGVKFTNLTIQCSVVATLEVGVAFLSQKSDLFLAYQIPGIQEGEEVTCTTTGNNGDADLYLRFGEVPGFVNGEYDCRGYTVGSNEMCSAGPAPKPTILYVVVHAWQGYSFSGLTVQCEIPSRYTPSPTPAPTKDQRTNSVASLGGDNFSSSPCSLDAYQCGSTYKGYTMHLDRGVGKCIEQCAYFVSFRLALGWQCGACQL